MGGGDMNGKNRGGCGSDKLEAETENPEIQPDAAMGNRTESPELLKVKEALAESEERFRVAFEQAPVGIVQGDLRGALRLTNQRVLELFGYEQESEFHDLRLWDCTHPADLWTVDQFKDLLAGKIQNYVVEKRYFRKNGGMWWARVSASMVQDDSGRPKYFIVIVEDINDRKLAEEALLKAHEEMEAKVAERTAELAASRRASAVCSAASRSARWAALSARAAPIASR